MPTSAAEGKDWARDRIIELAPRTVLDVGAGCGTYARLCRPFLPHSVWEAVEVWEPYVTRYALDRQYAAVHVRSAQQHDNWDFDLVIFGDVLEHMREYEAYDLVLRAQRSAKAVLVSCPIIHWEQGEMEGNPHEAHLEHYSPAKLREMTGSQFEWLGSAVGYFLWSRDAEQQ